jgi:hypothetical protein
MRVFKRCLGLLAASVMLASCGGGGGDGGAFTPPPSNNGTITITATAARLPLNRDDVGPFFGSPFMSELDITVRNGAGELVSRPDGVAVSINPVGVAGFSTLDDPTTPTEFDANGNYVRGNEFLTILGSGPVDVTGGHATIFVHSSTQAGVATVTVTFQEATTGVIISRTFAVTVENIAPPLPASVTVNANPPHVYVSGAGGSQTTILSAVIRDGGGQFVPDPGSGNTSYNNIQFEVVGGANYGTLSATGAGGSSTGAVVKTRSVQGVASAGFNSGSIQGPVQVRAVVDRADNNVDNGISEPLVGTETITVSDGKLFTLALTSPTEEAIFTGNVTGTPNQPNGSYTLIISAVAADRQGNPVAPGTVIRFGAVDSPLTGFPAQGPGTPVLFGPDGDPQESGTLFTAPTGRFTGPGERPGPGDTLLVFGDLVPGNRDLESARTISSINSATSLNVSVPFNRNDDTGNSVNNGPVIPYVIGRAQDAAIRDSGNGVGGVLGITNADGVATALLTYPVNRLGKRVYLYAQGDGVGVGTAIKKVTDIGAFLFAGIAPGELTANPEVISGNATSAVTVCLTDELGAPIQGVFVRFNFSALGPGGQGFVDNIPSSGTVEDPTGTNGCTVALVRTLGIGENSDDAQVIFSAAGLSDNVEITVSGGQGSLTAAPSHFRGNGGTVTLTLRDSSGNPVPGVNINTQCEGDVSIITPAGVTNAQGQTTAVIDGSDLNDYGEPGEGQCTFTAAGGEETIVTFTGIDLCGSGVSPPPPPELCGTEIETFTLTIQANPTAAAVPPAPSCGLNIVSIPAGLSCSAPAGGGAETCSGDFEEGTAVTLTAATTGANCPAPPGRTVNFSGDCNQTGAQTGATVMGSAKSCAITVTVP